MEQGEKSRVLRSKWVSGATQMSVPLKKSKTWFPDTGPWHLWQVRQRSCIRMLLQHFYNLRLDWNHQIRLRHPEFYFEMPCALNLRQLLIQPANRFFSLGCLAFNIQWSLFLCSWHYCTMMWITSRATSALWYQAFPYVSEQVSRASEVSKRGASRVSEHVKSAEEQTSEQMSGPFERRHLEYPRS